jgi:hypothetical protein
MTKQDAYNILTLALTKKLTFENGIYKGNCPVTYQQSPYWVHTINDGAGFNIEYKYQQTFVWTGSPDELREIKNEKQ